jgi:hypothetical protein
MGLFSKGLSPALVSADLSVLGSFHEVVFETFQGVRFWISWGSSMGLFLERPK